MRGGILTNNTRRNAVGRIIVEVMPKPEILDPQGKAVGSALPRLGITSFEAVRQGKCFHLSVDGPVTDELLDQARKAAKRSCPTRSSRTSCASRPSTRPRPLRGKVVQ